MKIWIRGAGDLATGIASRLYRSGHQLLMTELPVPLTVRRTVALSRAVYEQHAEVEDMSGELVHSIEEAIAIQKTGKIAIIIEEPEVILEEYQPDFLGTICCGSWTGIYSRSRLSLCRGDKARTYPWRCDLERNTDSEYRSPGKCRRIYH